jgi:putative endonuclease
MKAPHLLTGQNSELAARAWLEAQGLQHIAANFRCRYGELDLIMQDQQCLVIVEVRYRRTTLYGGALGSITNKKQQRIARAAQYFLQTRPKLRRQALRFDVIALSGTGGKFSFEWRKQAFCFDSN